MTDIIYQRGAVRETTTLIKEDIKKQCGSEVVENLDCYGGTLDLREGVPLKRVYIERCGHIFVNVPMI